MFKSIQVPGAKNQFYTFTRVKQGTNWRNWGIHDLYHCEIHGVTHFTRVYGEYPTDMQVYDACRATVCASGFGRINKVKVNRFF